MFLFEKTREKIKDILDSSLTRAIIIGLFSLSIILLALFYSIFVSKTPEDANRGGAIVVAISFIYIIKDARTADPNLSTKAKSYIEAQIQKEDRTLLSVMSFGGTIAWGFMDILARFIINILP